MQLVDPDGHAQGLPHPQAGVGSEPDRDFGAGPVVPPRRVFALPSELPGEQARFRTVAIAMTGLVGCAFVLGVAAAHLL